MKRFFSLLLVFLLSLALCVPAMAEEVPEELPPEAPVPTEEIVVEVIDPIPEIVPDITEEIPLAPDEPVSVPGADITLLLEEHTTLSVASVPVEVAGDLAADPLPEEVPVASSSMRDLMQTLFGEYQPRTQLVTVYFDGQPVASETQVVPGLAGMDYLWIAGVSLFALLLFCFMKLVGGLLKC